MADGSVIIKTNLDDSGIKSGLKKLGSVAGSALKGVAVATGVVTTAFAGLVTASVKATGELEQQIGGTEAVFKNYASNIQDMAKSAYSSMGLSANDYMATINKMGALMQGSGIDIKTSMDLSSQAMQRAADIASIMGIDTASAMESIAGAAKGNFTMMDNLGVAMNATTIEAYAMSKGIKTSYAEMENAQKVQLAMEMFLEKTTYAMGNYTKENETFAGSLTTMKASIQNFLSGSGDIQAVIDSVLSFTEITMQSISAIVPRIIESVTTALPQIIEAGTNIFTSLLQGIEQNKDNIITSTFTIINQLVNTILENLPLILQTGIEILVSLIRGIIEMMPELIPTIINCVILLVETLIDNLDMLVDAGIELLLAITLGIIEALPRLIDKVPEIINKLFTALMNNLPKLISAGIQVILMLITGIINSIPNLIGQLPNIIMAVFNALTAGFQIIWQVGKGIVTGLWEGLSSSITWLANKIKGWCNTIIGGIKSFFGIHSPSKLFKDEIGENLGLGIGEGFTDSLDDVYKDMKKAVESENAKLTSNLTSAHQIKVTNDDNTQSTLNSIDNNREIQVNSTLELDGKVVANTVNKVNAKQKLQYGIA